MKYQIRKGCFETNSSSMHSLIVTRKNSNLRMTQKEIREEFYLDEDWYKERHKNDEKEIVRLDLWDNEFGRSPFGVLSSFEKKLTYAIAEYCGDNYSIKSYLEADKTFDEVFAPLLTRLIGCDKVEWGKNDYRHFEVYVGGGEYLDEVEEVPYQKLVYVDKEMAKKEGLTENDLVGRCYKNVDSDGKKIEDLWIDVSDYGSIDHQSAGLLRRFLKANNLTLEDFLVRKDVVVVIDGDEYCELDNLIDCGLINKDSIVLRFPKSDSYDICEENEDEEMD